MKANAVELRKDRAAKVKEAGAILAAARAESRDLTPQEVVRFDKLHAEGDTLLREAEQIEAAESMERAVVARKIGEGAVPIRHAITIDGERVPLLGPEHRMVDLFPVSRGEPDLGDVLRGVVLGKWSSPEARTMAGASATGGGLLVAPSVSARIIDRARAMARTIQAGAQTLPMESRDVTIAKVATDPTAYWRGENAAITSSEVVFEGVKLQSRTVAALVKMPVELLEDAPNLGDLVESVLGSTIGNEIDRVGLVGSGAAEEPRGIENTPGITATGSIGSPVWDDLVDAVTAVRTANGEPSAAILHPRDVGTLAKLTGTANDHYLAPPEEIRNLRRLTTTQVPANRGGGANESLAFIGDFSWLWYGIRTALTVETSRQAADSSGSAFANMQVWIRAYVRMDTAVVRPGFFTVLSGITA